MRVRISAWVVGLSLPGTGCSLLSDAVHVTTYRVHQSLHDARELRRDRKLAAAAWDDVTRTRSGAAFSDDYADGFEEGFTEHLFRGTCEPPPVPPNKYRSPKHQTPEGYRAAEDWLAGFRHGADEARARGLRQFMTGPSSLRTAPPVTAAETAVPSVVIPPPTPTPPEAKERPEVRGVAPAGMPRTGRTPAELCHPRVPTLPASPVAGGDAPAVPPQPSIAIPIPILPVLPAVKAIEPGVTHVPPVTPPVIAPATVPTTPTNGTVQAAPNPEFKTEIVPLMWTQPAARTPDADQANRRANVPTEASPPPTLRPAPVWSPATATDERK